MVAGAAVLAQMTFDDLEAQARARQLTILGGFHPLPKDAAPAGSKTLLLLGPNEPDFWPAFTMEPEWQDGSADPMDRWSARVIEAWAKELGAKALFPFGGAPFLPFYSWATRTGRIHASPIQLLVHDKAGLFVSFRGALALSRHIALPPSPSRPCDTCETQPCLNCCPVGAIDTVSYDVPKYKTHLNDLAGAECMSRGCAARRACPVSQRYARLDAQSAYHMRVFKG